MIYDVYDLHIAPIRAINQDTSIWNWDIQYLLLELSNELSFIGMEQLKLVQIELKYLE